MSQAGTPYQPGTLNQAEQQQLIQEIGRVILRSLPPGWAETSIEYRAMGAHREVTAHLIAPGGTAIPLAAPPELRDLFARLRDGMHQPDRGTWFSALYRLQRPSSYSVDFNGDYEPAWDTPPVPGEFAEELRRYPRASSYVPAWFVERANPEAASGLRVADVFDGADSAGRPIANRPAIPAEERERLVAYLEAAPVVLAAHGYDHDRLAPDGTPSVPLTYHTDGSWIWPGAVAYYLRRHSVPPDANLVSHIRESGFRVPEVDDRQRELAVSQLSRAARG